MDKHNGVPLSPEALALFQEGISLVLSRWCALQLAVENEWGGRNSREKALQLASDIFSWFTQTKEDLYIDDLEGLLDEALMSLNTEAEDGSIGEVAYDLMSMHEQCLEGNYESIQNLKAASAQPVSVHHIKQAVDDDDDDDEEEGEDDEDDMMVDVPRASHHVPAPMVQNEPKSQRTEEAEDGWVTVSRKNKGRKN